MAKRVQEQKEDEIIVTKSRPTAMNLSSTVSASSWKLVSAKNLITSSDPVKLMAAGNGNSLNLNPTAFTRMK